MKADERFEDLQIEKDTACEGCDYTIIKDSWVHKMKVDGNVYCTACYKEMRNLD